MNTPDKQKEVVIVNGKMPIRHWVIQSLISLTMGGIVSATAAVVAIKYDMRELRLTLVNQIELHAVKTGQQLEDHEHRIKTNEGILDEAFPRNYSKP
jgi:hypothetical protein